MEHLENTIAQMRQTMADICGVSLQDLCTSRRVPLPDARAIIYAALRNQGYSCSEIGRSCGKDHSTIEHALKRLYDMTETDARIRDIFAQFNQALI